MDDDVKQAFDAVHTRLDAVDARLDAVQGVLRDMTGQINGKLDDLLDRKAAVRSNTDGTRGHLAFVLEDSLTLGRRITRLEEEIRRVRG